MKITFMGATQEVTGSRTLIEQGDTKVLIDCGLFQGDVQLREQNWDPFPVDPHSIKSLVLTHAHIDHTGYIPAFVKKGFKGPIYCSKPTFELCKILLLDSAMIQEEDAKKQNEEDPSHKIFPLYTREDAEYALRFFKPIAYDTEIDLGDGLRCRLIQSGHILGASFVVLSDGKRTLTFSGDLGRPQQVVMKSPPFLTSTDYLVLESTYGDRLHKEGDPEGILKRVVEKTVKQGGVLIIPAFAVGRTQIILYYLFQMRELLKKVPIFLDSPMAINVTQLYCDFNNEHKFSKTSCTNAFSIAQYVTEVKESKKLDQLKQPAIIIAGSGMANGGRVIDHFKYYISDPRSTVLFVGFQAKGTLGRKLVEGAQEITIRGKKYPVRASIESILSLSAHADYNEILEWLSHFEKAPKEIFLNHGEKESAESLQKKIQDRFGWNVVIPSYLESFELS